METRHRQYYRSSSDLGAIDDASVELIVTSPPYPMIAMWDEVFGAQDPAIGDALSRGDGIAAYDLMHGILDRTWRECFRVLKPGGFACINIGDATRTVEKNFRLYTNHSRVAVACEDAGFQSLPAVIWRKQTNAPNKFMGSGMLPSGAYVTLEHEYVLIFRKEGKRVFTAAERERRRRSALFWEERNAWFSDLWDFKGVTQRLNNADARARSGAYPLELPFRLINMYSLQEDTVLDPFAGTGTTAMAALATGRHSIGIEIDSAFAPTVAESALYTTALLNGRQQRRLEEHRMFVNDYREQRRYEFKHFNRELDTPVMTSQETDLRLSGIADIRTIEPDHFLATHADLDTCRSAQPASRGGVENAGQLDLALDN